MTFDASGCYSSLKAHMKDALMQIANEFLDDAKSNMNTPEGFDSMQDISPADIEMVAEVMTIRIVGGAWAAMDVFGTGSLMDKDNPALAGYMNSPNWNPSRNSHSIAGRPAGSYTNIFGEQKTSSGNREGQNIEWVFKPEPPSHAIQIAARWMAQSRISVIVLDAISSFSFANFIVVTKE